MQASGPPDQKVVLFDYTCNRAQDVLLRLLKNYCGYIMTDDYAGYNALALQSSMERLGHMVHTRRKFVDSQKVQLREKTGRTDIVLAMIDKLYSIERDLKKVSDKKWLIGRQERSLSILVQLKSWPDKTYPHVIPQSILGKAVHYMRNNWRRLKRCAEARYLCINNNVAERAIKPFVIGLKAGCSVIPSTVPASAQRAAVWSRPCGYATHLSDCCTLLRLNTMKPYCRGVARQRCNSKSLTHR